MTYFLKQFAQRAVTPIMESTALGTMTATAAKEGQDQDKQLDMAFGLGTMTLTETIEGIDQDITGILGECYDTN